MVDKKADKTSKLNIPEDPGKTATTIVGDKIVFIRYEYDQDPTNPLDDMDGVGAIYSFSSRHASHNREAIEEALQDKDRVFLSYFEHTLCRWGVSGTMEGMPDFQWDGVSQAGVWVPDKVIVEQADSDKLTGKKRAEWMAQQAADACKLYTDFCNGTVYYYSVEVYPLLKAADGEPLDLESDYRHTEALFEDSCGGLYGPEGLEDGMMDAVAGAEQELAKAPQVASPALA